MGLPIKVSPMLFHYGYHLKDDVKQIFISGYNSGTVLKTKKLKNDYHFDNRFLIFMVM